MDDQTIKLTRTLSPAWSIPVLCAGLCIIGVCVLIPQSEMNRKLVAERDKLKSDLAYVNQQLAVNDLLPTKRRRRPRSGRARSRNGK